LECRSAREHTGTPFWSEVKGVFRELQGNKCAYCERVLPSGEVGVYEHDVEHFRPKGGIQPWPVPIALSTAGIVCSRPPDDNKGYYLLAYHPQNYAVSCKTCNEGIKKSYFPIARVYELTGEDPQLLLQHELPLLIFPLGDFDDDPETIIAKRSRS
jgi:hypothetical protein